MTVALTLSLLPETFAICRLEPGTPLHDLQKGGSFFSITSTMDELSVVCPVDSIPSTEIKADRDWSCFKLHGPFPFDLVGILNSVTAPLAEAKVGIFAISTYDTDYVLVKQELLESAIAALRKAGHTVYTD